MRKKMCIYSMNILLSNIVVFCCLRTQRPSLVPMELFYNPDRHILLTHPKARNIQGHRVACGESIKTPGMEDNKQKTSLKKSF